MADKNFFKDNFVLVVGIALPVILMVGFMVASSLPQTLNDPPKYDLVFSSPDYRSNGIPVYVNLVVKEGVLKAQYTKPPANQNYPNNQWFKLYEYDAKTRQVRELSFGLPDNTDDIKTMREDVVEATKNLKLDTNLKSPDGYELTNESYSHGGGLVGDIFGGWGSYSSEMRLRKGASSVRLSTGDGNYPFAYGNANFIGWVKQ